MMPSSIEAECPVETRLPFAGLQKIEFSALWQSHLSDQTKCGRFFLWLFSQLLFRGGEKLGVLLDIFVGVHSSACRNYARGTPFCHKPWRVSSAKKQQLRACANMLNPSEKQWKSHNVGATFLHRLILKTGKLPGGNLGKRRRRVQAGRPE